MKRLGVAIVSLGVFLLLWKAVVVIGGYPEYLMPAPEAVAERGLRAVQSGVLWEHTAATLLEALGGFAVGAGLAIVIGTALGKSVVVERALSPYIVAAQAIPILALAPLLDIWFGGGLLARVAIAALIVFFPIAIATMVGIRSADPLLAEMLRSLGATPAQRTRILEIPSALPAGRSAAPCPVVAKSAFRPPLSQSDEWRWKEEPAAPMSYFAMNVTEQPWRCAISLAPCL